MTNQEDHDQAGTMSVKDMQSWLEDEIHDSAKAHELRVKGATEFVTAYAEGKLTPEQAAEALVRHDKCSFTPEMTTHQNKIIICDFPMLEYGQETGRLINCLIKLIFQRAWLRRNLNDSPNPVFLWQDEFQYFVTRQDNFFQQTCRGSRVAVVCLTQNILNLSEELGEAQPGSKTKSFLGNLAIKVFHQQNDVETAIYAADQIGKEYRYLDNYSGGGSSGSEHTHFSAGASRTLAYVIEPADFSKLKKPDSTSPLSQAIVYLSGKTLNATITERNPKGSNYLSVFFSRD